MEPPPFFYPTSTASQTAGTQSLPSEFSSTMEGSPEAKPLILDKNGLPKKKRKQVSDIFFGIVGEHFGDLALEDFSCRCSSLNLS